MGDPIDAIEAMLKARGWTRRHLMAAFGTTARISEIMNRKRPLSIGMIRCLVFNFGMDADVMIQWYPTERQPRQPANPFDVLLEVANG
jgi:HTH-type transcriptional regulator/antitoxin HigA